MDDSRQFSVKLSETETGCYIFLQRLKQGAFRQAFSGIGPHSFTKHSDFSPAFIRISGQLLSNWLLDETLNHGGWCKRFWKTSNGWQYKRFWELPEAEFVLERDLFVFFDSVINLWYSDSIEHANIDSELDENWTKTWSVGTNLVIHLLVRQLVHARENYILRMFAPYFRTLPINSFCLDFPDSQLVVSALRENERLFLLAGYESFIDDWSGWFGGLRRDSESVFRFKHQKIFEKYLNIFDYMQKEKDWAFLYPFLGLFEQMTKDNVFSLLDAFFANAYSDKEKKGKNNAIIEICAYYEGFYRRLLRVRKMLAGYSFVDEEYEVVQQFIQMFQNWFDPNTEHWEHKLKQLYALGEK